MSVFPDISLNQSMRSSSVEGGGFAGMLSSSQQVGLKMVFRWSSDNLHSTVYIVTVTEQQPVHHDGQQPGPHHPHLPRLRQGPQPECRLQVTIVPQCTSAVYPQCTSAVYPQCTAAVYPQCTSAVYPQCTVLLYTHSAL